MVNSWHNFRQGCRWSAAIVLLCTSSAGAAEKSRFAEHPDQHRRFLDRVTTRANRERAVAAEWARQRGLPMREKRGRQVIELIRIRNGKPVYYTTFNADAAISTATDLVRNTSPYNLNGDGISVGIWDGGSVRNTHIEFGNRVSLKNASAELNDHATHVSGTVGASGVNSQAKGMAPAAAIFSYDWVNDLGEMGNAAATAPNQSDKVYLSNHSYGLLNPAGYLGVYMQDTAYVDELVYNHRYYLPFIAAGNERDDGFGTYGTISYYGIAKNVVTVGAVHDAVSGSSRSLAAAQMTDFSSWGPADDGRIKPDVVANGHAVYSTVASGDTSYERYGVEDGFTYAWSGTSMACPNASGSAALLVEHYTELFPGEAMWASSLKGLIIHTADDIGPAGPDYQFGWGLMNTKAAADLLIALAERSPQTMIESELTSSGPEVEYLIKADQSAPLKITLCWTDPAGATQGADNLSTAHLVNDLDLRVSGPDGLHYPYRLDRGNPSFMATTGDNTADNVEQVYIEASVAGTYTITISHKGVLENGEQEFSLWVSGVSSDTDEDGLPDFWEERYFSSITGAYAYADEDGDRSDNLTEYIAGTLPNDPESVFKVTQFSPWDSAPFILHWNAVEGRTYNVLWSSSLQFISFAEHPISGDLPYPINSYTDEVLRASDENFYRVDVKLNE
jgi:hypothetical protein